MRAPTSTSAASSGLPSRRRDKAIDLEAAAYHASTSGADLIIELADEPHGSVTLRFGQTNWHRINLFNSAHIPALPFEAHC